MSKAPLFNAPKHRQAPSPTPEEMPEATALLSAHVPLSTKRRFDDIAHQLRIKKRDLLIRMIEAYAEALDEHA